MIIRINKENKMHPIKSCVLCCLCTVIFLFHFSNKNYGQNSYNKKTFSIVDYGAVPDGKTLNTKAIQTAVDAASKYKGGRVIFPRGRFLTGSVELKSDMELYLEEGSVLLGSTHPDDYKPMNTDGRPVSPKKDDNSQLALLLAHKANNILLSGKGIIDGQGRALALNIDSLHHAGVRVDPNYSKKNMRPSETVRPKLFRFSECKQVNVSGLTIKNGACWGLSFELCTNLTIDNIALTNRAYWNNDGMDITDCRNVRITNCDVNAADDGICLKSYYPGYSNDGVYIANCTIRSSASAIKFGTASYGGFKNVTIENIKIFDTFRSAIALETVDGGTIENINIHNINAVNTGNAIFIRLGHRDGEKPGIVRNIHIKGVKVQVPFDRPDINYDMRGPEVDFFHNPFASSIVGIPGHIVEDLVLENIEISYPGRASKGMAYVPLSRLDQVPENEKSYPEFSMFGELPAWGFYIRHVSGLTFKNIKLTLANEDFRPAFVFDDVTDLKMKQIKLPDPGKKQIILYKTNNVEVDNNVKSGVSNL
ncbi:MAG: glycoside hydrolase family 28 protein [Chitinophagaceae bacterium]